MKKARVYKLCRLIAKLQEIQETEGPECLTEVCKVSVGDGAVFFDTAPEWKLLVVRR
jgi:hypothetical protein